MRWRWVIVGVAVLVGLSIPAGWLMAKNSDAYAAAVNFVKSNPQAREKLGTVRDVSLAPFGYSVRYSGAHGEASFDLTVSGQKGSAMIYVELEKKGIWEVRLARLVENEKTLIQLR